MMSATGQQPGRYKSSNEAAAANEYDDDGATPRAFVDASERSGGRGHTNATTTCCSNPACSCEVCPVDCECCDVLASKATMFVGAFDGAAATVAEKQSSKQVREEEGSTVQIGIFVGGLTCSNCVRSITNAIKLSSLNEGGIQDVKVNLSTGYALVTYAPKLMGREGMGAIEAIVESIDDAGYEASLDLSTVPRALRDRREEKGVDIIEANEAGATTPLEGPRATRGQAFASAEDRSRALKERQENDMRKKLNAFLWSLLGSLPILIITMILGRVPLIRDEVLQVLVVPGLTVEALVLWILATPVQFGSGFTFYRNSYKNIRNRMLGQSHCK